MSGKQNNFGRRGDDESNYRKFGGTGSLGDYNTGAGRHDGHNNNRQSSAGLGDGGNFNRSFDNKGTNRNNSFQKFRDPNAFVGRNNNNERWRRDGRPDGRRDGRRRRHGKGGGGFQNHGNQTRKDGVNRYEDSRGAKPLIGNQQHQQIEIMQQTHELKQQPHEQQQQFHEQQPQQPTEYPPAKNLPVLATNSPAPAVGTASETPAANAQNLATIVPEVPVLGQQEILKNIKKEKIVMEVSKQIIKPPPSSSSSSSDSSDSEDGKTSKPVQTILKTKAIKTEAAAKETGKKIISPPTASSSSSSSSSEEEESDHEAPKTSKSVAKATVGNAIKTSKKPVKSKKSSEEDLICLGKLEKKFVIEDEESEESDESPSQTVKENRKDRCLICDKQGHTAFECQMICKNCSTPYHNMKSCPKPANLSIVMQSFMEFCMGQMNQFNPEQKFTLPSYFSANDEKLTKGAPSTTANKKSKKANAKSKEPLKKLVKRKRKRSAKSSDEEEDDDDEEVKEDETEEEASTESDSESESSAEKAARKTKKKRTRIASISAADAAEFPNTFIPPFSNFPSFGAAAAAYNPLLLSQLMHAGNFGTPKKRNFK